MTIAVGFYTPDDGVILCADRQLTKEGGLKFERNKIRSRHSSDGQPYNLIFTYAGDPDAAALLFRSTWFACSAVSVRFNDKIKELIWLELEDGLQKVFQSKEAKLAECLIGVQFDVGCRLFRTHKNRVILGQRECIGVGDSSVIEYMSEIASQPPHTQDDAKRLAIYLVSLGNRFIDGCGGGANAALIAPNRPIQLMSKTDTAKYLDGFQAFERDMEKRFFE